jgi:hypothetical protein
MNKLDFHNINEITSADLEFLYNYWSIITGITTNTELSDSECYRKINEVYNRKIDLILNCGYYMNFKQISTLITTEFIIRKKETGIFVYKHGLKDVFDHTLIYNLLFRYNHPMNEVYEIKEI